MQESKRYRIIIREIGTERKILPKEWHKGAGPSGEEYGYAPEVETFVDYELNIYEQTVDNLDLPAVVSVVNKIGPA